MKRDGRTLRLKRSGSAFLNNKPRFISRAQAVLEKCRVARCGVQLGRIRDVILCSLGQFGQQVPIGLMRSRLECGLAVPVEIISDVCACRTHAVISLEVHALRTSRCARRVRQRRCLSRPAPIHVELAASDQNGIGELAGRELAALIGVDDLGRAVSCKGFLQSLPA